VNFQFFGITYLTSELQSHLADALAEATPLEHLSKDILIFFKYAGIPGEGAPRDFVLFVVPTTRTLAATSVPARNAPPRPFEQPADLAVRCRPPQTARESPLRFKRPGPSPPNPNRRRSTSPEF